MIEKLKQNTIFRNLLLFIMTALSFVNRFIPKKKTQILFYDSGRDYLDDNTEAFYTWLRQQGLESKYKMICCVPRERTKHPFSDYEPVGALKGILAFLTSGYVFYSFGDFRIKPSKKQIVVNQWHGTPLKKIGKLTYDKSYQSEKLDNFTYLLVSSDIYVPIMAQAFGCSVKKIKVIGNARNDYLFSDKDALTPVHIDKKLYKKLILWMPTFRKSVGSRFSDGNTETSETMLPVLDTYGALEKIDGYLQETGVLLVIKIHPMAVFKRNNYRNILTVTNDDLLTKGVKLYEFIKEFDALLTDYSSVFCDYLLLDRSMGFTLDDYEKYENSRGFILNHFREYLPGYLIYTPEDIKNYIDNVVQEKDLYTEKRAKITPVFNKYTDGKNCSRLAQSVGLLP